MSHPVITSGAPDPVPRAPKRNRHSRYYSGYRTDSPGAYSIQPPTADTFREYNRSRSSYYNGQTSPDTQPPYVDTLQKHTAEWVGDFFTVLVIETLPQHEVGGEPYIACIGHHTRQTLQTPPRSAYCYTGGR